MGIMQNIALPKVAKDYPSLSRKIILHITNGYIPDIAYKIDASDIDSACQKRNGKTQQTLNELYEDYVQLLYLIAQTQCNPCYQTQLKEELKKTLASIYQMIHIK